MELLNTCVHDINRYLWGVFFLIPLLCGTGIFYTIRLRFVQVRYFGWAARYLFGGASLFGKKADQSGMSSFQALATAVAAQVGTGNVAGTATAIVSGGPGALFWLWLAAFFGMATIFAEAVLALTFRTRDASGHIVGGPAVFPFCSCFSTDILAGLRSGGSADRGTAPHRAGQQHHHHVGGSTRADVHRCRGGPSSSADVSHLHCGVQPISSALPPCNSAAG